METGFFIAFVSLSGGFGLGFILGFCLSELFESSFDLLVTASDFLVLSLFAFILSAEPDCFVFDHVELTPPPPPPYIADSLRTTSVPAPKRELH